MKAIKASKNMDRQPGNKFAVVLLAVFIIFGATLFPLRPAKAFPVEDIPALVWDKITDFAGKLWRTAGSVAYQRTLTTALNKIAYDTATWLGSGGQGQQPLFITESWEKYLWQIGDEAGGQFLETFVNNLNRDDPQDCENAYTNCMQNCTSGDSNCWDACAKQSTACVSGSNSAINTTPSFNVCAPSSLSAKLRIGLGLVEQSRPQGPNCTVSAIVRNWSTDSLMKAAGLGGTGMTQEQYLNNFASFFDPRSNDLGIYVSARAELMNQQESSININESKLIANKGWLDVRNIAGETESPPGTAERSIESANRVQETNIGTITGDAFVDAANVFINQYAISAFNELIRSLTSKSKGGSSSIQASLSNPLSDPSAYYGISSLKESTTKLLQPNFGVRTDYNILSSLVVCPDPENPGPDNCVIDDQFMQAISEKKTVAEAVAGNYLHGDWQFTNDNLPSVYALRNISILRKYRIVPVGWEMAVQRITSVNPPKKATLRDLVSCFDKTDKYNDFSSEFDQRDQNWCEGLVDPNWVLKAPLNYCRQEGVGAQILNKTVLPGSDGASSTLSIIRADDYCADNQTCIKEKPDGSCEAYGYCDEEKRTWSFGNSSTCEPINNTCQAFVSPSGTTVAYLQNTLDYGTCSPDNSGCRRYALGGSYSVDTGKVAWNQAANVYFNKNLSSCASADEGCTALLRVKPTWGSNLVMASDFGNDNIGDASVNGKLNDWPLNSSDGTIVDASSEPGGAAGKAIKIITTGAAGGVYSVESNSLLPTNFQTIPGQAYTVSADVYLQTGNSVRLVAGASVAEGYVKSTEVKGKWQHLTVTRPADVSYNSPEFYITGTASSGQATFYIRNVKFESSNWDTGVSAYGSYKVYEKLLPSYLESSCYVDAANGDYRLKSAAPAACASFARKCNKSEVGCESYVSVADGFTVPAQVTSSDYCSEQCLGYDAYIARGSYFFSSVSDNLIPSTAQACNAAAAGCAEFTNLDAVSQGGETKEYYSTLKQCVKPAAASCATFYSWEGTGAGYQLRSYSLKKDALNLPAVTANDSALCNEAVYRLSVSDPGYNSDCRQYYNSTGQVAYHLASRTITCSDNCHAYRLTEKNVDRSLTAAQCTGTDKHWDPSAQTCNVCLNGGTWDNTRSACIYNAIPGEGTTCQAAENGCREYNGSRGANTRLLAAFDFESGLEGWGSNCTSGVAQSTVANSNNGHSLQYNNNITCSQAIGSQQSLNTVRRRIIEELLASENLAAQVKVSGLVSQGNPYTVRFIARSSSDIALKIFFINPATGQRSDFNQGQAVPVSGGNEWQIYTANLDSLGHEVGADEVLAITANGTFNIDDIILSEITDRYYLIRNSSQVPTACYYDLLDNYQGAEYNLGCAQYSDRAGLKHNLHRFSSLCSDSSVGCEQMIDTKNSTSYRASYWYKGVETDSCAANDPDCLIVPQDTAVYAVYDTSKQCGSSSQGCSRLGEGQGGASLTGWTDVYKKNNPDQYPSSLCSAENVGCEAWRNADNSQTSYFKDPGSQTCLYRESTTPGVPGKGWYRVPVSRCDLDGDGKIKDAPGYLEQSGPVCISDSDCSGSRKCLADTNDYACTFSFEKTFGRGGANNQVPVPDIQAGLCDVGASTCTEYIDPVSRPAANIVLNPSFVTDQGEAGPSGWGTNSVSGWSGGTAAANQQFLKVRPNTIYRLTYRPSGSGTASGTVSLQFQNTVKQLMLDNQLGTGTNDIKVTASEQPIIFNSLHNDYALLSGGDTSRYIEVKELIVDYQLQKNLDKQSCNGLTDFNDGCVLFNERSVSGASGLANLGSAWDPYHTGDREAPQSCSSGSSFCAANQLIKVRPDRVCGRWLDCISYIRDPYTKKKTCYAFAECDRLDDKGECANFINPEGAVVPQISQNATGYSLYGRYNLSGMRPYGSLVENFNGGFDNGSECNANYCVINGPDSATTDYPAEGQGYLRIEAGKYYEFPEQTIRAVSGDEFFVSYLLNTKKSGGASGVVKLIYDDVNVSVGTEKAETGWQRKVSRFYLNPGLKKVKIRLEAQGTGAVYFDDVAIQPVLKISNSSFAVPECRLYPSNDSLTCFSKNENVVANGLEGYCLEHDPWNPNVCLLWYPMDNIPVPSVSRLGYQGNFPLNYCTQINGNFDFVEKRRGYELFFGETDDEVFSINCKDVDHIDTGIAWDSTNWKYPVPNPPPDTCPPDYQMWRSATEGDGCGNLLSDCNIFVHYMCVPRANKLVDRLGRSMEETSNANHGVSANRGDWGKCQNRTYSVGYGVFNGYDGYEAGAAVSGYVQDSEQNPTPDIRIIDYAAPYNSVADLKMIPGTFDSFDTGNVNYFHFTCNQLAKAVDVNGANAMWVKRASEPGWALSGGNLASGVTFTQPMASSPFGGLIGNINVNDSVLSLRDLKTAPFAGLPFGCLDGTGSSCKLIGRCVGGNSGTSTILCLATSTPNLVTASCGAGNGQCEPLFNSSLSFSNSSLVFERAREVLKTITLRGLDILKSNGTNYVSDGAGFSLENSIPDCSNQIRPAGGYCAVLPKLENVKLFFNDNPVILGSNSYDVKQKGIYRLEFNSTVDPEQQPLRKIEIDWGDGYLQTITNQDNLPPTGDPHVLYHYYNQVGPKSIRIRITDNWTKTCGTGEACAQ